MKRHRNTNVKVPILHLPEDILLNHKDIEIYIDFFYINRMPFLYKNSSNITFLTAQIISSRSAYRIIKELQTVASMYTARAFNISIYHGGN